MEQLQNLFDFAQRYITVEMIILIILVIGTFLLFSFFIQDLLQDYFKEYREKQKRELEAGNNREKKPKLKARQPKSRPRLVKTSGDEKTAKAGNKARDRKITKGGKSNKKNP